MAQSLISAPAAVIAALQWFCGALGLGFPLSVGLLDYTILAKLATFNLFKNSEIKINFCSDEDERIRVDTPGGCWGRAHRAMMPVLCHVVRCLLHTF